MIDLMGELQSNGDLGVLDTQVERAGNILSTQLGSLEYLPDFGVDIKFFLSNDFKFQNESFKTYLMNVLASSSINVASLVETIETFYSKYTFNLSSQSGTTALIAR